MKPVKKALRRTRQRITLHALRAGQKWAMRSPGPEGVEQLRRLSLALTRVVFPLRSRLATNLRLAGVYRDGLVDDHFERAVDHLMMMAHIFRAGIEDSGCIERFELDDSFRHLQQAYDAGRGVVHIAPHLCGFPVYPAVASRRVPCVLYIRHNKDPRKMQINQAIGQAAGTPLVFPPLDADRGRRLQVAIDVLRRGEVLYITPDTPREPHKGIPVEMFGRTVHFPTGVFVMAMRTGSPIVPCTWYWQDGVYKVRYGEPIELNRKGRIRELAESITRDWNKSVESFLREHPAMWWHWLDKRWTRMIRGLPIK